MKSIAGRKWQLQNRKRNCEKRFGLFILKNNDGGFLTPRWYRRAFAMGHWNINSLFHCVLQQLGYDYSDWSSAVSLVRLQEPRPTERWPLTHQSACCLAGSSEISSGCSPKSVCISTSLSTDFFKSLASFSEVSWRWKPLGLDSSERTSLK